MAGLPVTMVDNGSPVSPGRQGIPVTVVGENNTPAAVLFAGNSFETDDGGTVTIDAVVNGVITAATYTPAP
jgi:Na+-translocating ferredoxin:NAD+ oxidoreductase RnfG subunit